MANGDPVRISVQADSHADVLFLPPMAVRRFAGRAFVVIQDGEKQRRIDLMLGLENDAQVEIQSGLKAGDVVIGQ
jgi:membrane fusion protein, macrolide-specific efflux system